MPDKCPGSRTPIPAGAAPGERVACPVCGLVRKPYPVSPDLVVWHRRNGIAPPQTRPAAGPADPAAPAVAHRPGTKAAERVAAREEKQRRKALIAETTHRPRCAQRDFDDARERFDIVAAPLLRRDLSPEERQLIRRVAAKFLPDLNEARARLLRCSA